MPSGSEIVIPASNRFLDRKRGSEMCRPTILALALLVASCAQGTALVATTPATASNGESCGTSTAAIGAAEGWPAPVTPRSEPGRIVARWVDWFGESGSALVEVKPSGEQVQLVQARGATVPFAVSPDGRRLAFAEDALEAGSAFPTELVITMLDGSESDRVYTANESISGLSWSPDSRSLAFIADQTLRRVDVSDLAVSKVSDAPAPSFAQGFRRSAWSSDGTWILFSAGAYQSIERVAPDGSGRALFSLGNAFAWSPDGREIAVAGIDGITVARPDGSGVRHVVAGPAGQLSWRPDGRAIAYTNDEGYPEGALCMIQADGSMRTLAPCISPPLSPPAWSPDGSRVAFLEMLSPGGCRQTADVRLSVVSIESGDIVPLTDEWLGDPIWAMGSE